MSLHYVDASSWSKLISDEAESEAMLDHLEEIQSSGGRFISSYLLTTELHRAAIRLGIPAAGVIDALEEVDLRLPDRGTFELAGRLSGLHLRSFDAIHVATAIDVQADAFVTYDARQALAATEAGLDVIAPGT